MVERAKVMMLPHMEIIRKNNVGLALTIMRDINDRSRYK